MRLHKLREMKWTGKLEVRRQQIKSNQTQAGILAEVFSIGVMLVKKETFATTNVSVKHWPQELGFYNAILIKQSA